MRPARTPGRAGVARERPAGQLDDLQRAHHPAAVPGQDRGRGVRVDAAPAGRAARPAPAAASSASSRARTAGSVGGISSRSSTARTYSPDPPTRTGTPPARGDRRPRAARASPLVRGHAGLLGDVEHVEQVVRHAAALGRRQLRRADVHAAVELHGVGVDHLAAERAAPARAPRSDLPVAVAPTTATTTGCTGAVSHRGTAAREDGRRERERARSRWPGAPRREAEATAWACSTS